MLPRATIIPLLETDTEGITVVLERCQLNKDNSSTKTTAQLVNYLNIEWFGPDNHPLTGDDIIVGDDVIINTGRTRTLTIPEATLKDSGGYSCQVTLDLQDNTTETVSSQYHLVLFSEL